ncbi:glycosyltransferase [Synechococcus sp. M16CYN]|uniref:glycosyltransferase n=1 Tax=Synechococcus sp. M16CYN TaxID=3103139 RepID=UPI00324F406F
MTSNAATNDHRRVKSAGFLFACGCAGASPHWLDSARSLWPAISLALLLGGYALRTVLRGKLLRRSAAQSPIVSPTSLQPGDVPPLDVIVAARDEETVVTCLVERLIKLRYPADRLSIWVVDDGSLDRTPALLDSLADRHPRLNVIHRSRDAGGGKSGALNAALAQLKGDWLLVLDADAQLQGDLLEMVMPYALDSGWSAVQLRKAVVDADRNWLTRSQAMEMALDAVIQAGRLTGGGVAELRGNGQLIKRSVLEASGGFNEDTVTDDLDLSFRLLTNGALVGILWDPPVQEEAVAELSALWKQRQRWAEGGLQRFFDYWPTLTSAQLSPNQRWDLACFFLLQYGLPVVSFADLSTSVISRTPPTYWPLCIVAFSVSAVAYLKGCRGANQGPAIPSPGFWNLLVAIAYLGHWFVVIPWVTLRMAFLPKRLVWAKTSHGEKDPLQV